MAAAATQESTLPATLPACLCVDQVSKGEVVGDKVVLTTEPSKGGASETIECDTCLVAIGE